MGNVKIIILAVMLITVNKIKVLITITELLNYTRYEPAIERFIS